GARDVRIEVRGNRLLVRVAGAAPVRAALDPLLAGGGVAFEIAARSRHTLVFHRPTLGPLRTG
ncbi:hypothetical protein, partial [Actinomadura roseirufa]|uniref:hypothetical protein n=1 Tax=Actinomadura roseirufa TaxID=2094049 RepID=UPI0013F14569